MYSFCSYNNSSFFSIHKDHFSGLKLIIWIHGSFDRNVRVQLALYPQASLQACGH